MTVQPGNSGSLYRVGNLQLWVAPVRHPQRVKRCVKDAESIWVPFRVLMEQPLNSAPRTCRQLRAW